MRPEAPVCPLGGGRRGDGGEENRRWRSLRSRPSPPTHGARAQNRTYRFENAIEEASASADAVDPVRRRPAA